MKVYFYPSYGLHFYRLSLPYVYKILILNYFDYILSRGCLSFHVYIYIFITGSQSETPLTLIHCTTSVQIYFIFII